VEQPGLRRGSRQSHGIAGAAVEEDVGICLAGDGQGGAPGRCSLLGAAPARVRALVARFQIADVEGTASVDPDARLG